MRDARAPLTTRRAAGAHRPATRLRKTLGWLVFAVLFGGLWLVAAPTALGGPASYVIVDGSSMEPTYHDGDLVIARAQSAYEIGEVITYVPEVAQQPFPVIHRIVEVSSDGQYVTRGDNRTQADSWLATDANIVGASWVHVPYGGHVVRHLRQPFLWLALAAGSLTLGVLTRMEERRTASLAETP